VVDCTSSRFRGIRVSRRRCSPTSGKLSPATTVAALADLADLQATRHGHEPLLPRVWGLRGNLTAYDAAYVALPGLLDAALLTSDRALTRSSGHSARIELA